MWMVSARIPMLSVLFSCLLGSAQCTRGAGERDRPILADGEERTVATSPPYLPPPTVAIHHVDTLPRSLRMNEPAGFIPFAISSASSVPNLRPEEDREGDVSDEGENSVDMGRWYTFPLRNPRLQVVEDPSAPVSPPKVMRVRFPEGWQAGRGPVTWGGWDRTGKGRPGQKEKVYFSMWIKLEGSGYENQRVGTKMGFFGAARPTTMASHSTWFFLKGDGQQAVESAFEVEVHQSFVTSERPGETNVILRQNTDRRRIMTVGIWHHWEALLELNAPGQSNGILKWWIDGDLVMSYDNMTYIYGRFTNGFFDFNFNPTWGGTGGVKRKDDAILIDHIYISGVPMTSRDPEPVDQRRRPRP
jgi:hypothetical protein